MFVQDTLDLLNKWLVLIGVSALIATILLIVLSEKVAVPREGESVGQTGPVEGLEPLTKPLV